MPKPKRLSENELSSFLNKRKVIRLRVCNFLRQWIENYWKDFTDNKEIWEKLYDFINERMSKAEPIMADQLSKLLKRKSEGIAEMIVETPKAKPTPILPKKKELQKVQSKSDKFSLLDFDPEEIARQITLIDFELYKSIQPLDFLNKGWTKKDKEIHSPNLLSMIKRFNEFSKWVAAEIVFVENLKERANILSKWIEIAEKCKNLNNFSAIMAIVSALQSTGVFRLKLTWNSISSSHRNIFEELKKIVSREGNFRNLRQQLKKCSPPCVPYIGIFLTDLTFIEDGNANFLEGGLINFNKRRRMARVLREIQQYQQGHYNLQPVTFIQDFILSGSGLEEQEVYNISLTLEARTGGSNLKKEDETLIASLKQKRNTISSVNEFKRVSNIPMMPSSSFSNTSNNPPKETLPSKRDKKIQELQNKFYSAVRSGNLERVKSLLLQGISLKGNVDAHSQTPLHIACYEGHKDMVIFFLGIKDPDIGTPEIDAKDKSGWTALHCASSSGYLDICEILLKHRANPSIANHDKSIPLHYLSRRNPEIKNKKNKNKATSTINTITNLEESQYFRVIKMMIDNGADINFKDHTGNTPLHQAASTGNEEGVKILLKLKANIYITNNNDETPLMCAEQGNNINVAKLLLEIEEQKREKKGLTPHSILKPDDIYTIVKLMKDPQHGVSIKDRKHILITYKKCFVGSEAVDWMVKNGIRTRDEAIRLGQKLIDSQFIQHVTKSNKIFKDNDKSFYYFIPEESYQQLKAKITSFREDSNDNISLNDFELLKVLGEGIYGKVLLARKKDSKQVLSLKVIDKESLLQEGELDTLLPEKKILQNDSPFLVHLYYAFQSQKHIFFSMDFIAGGDLGTHLKREERFSEQKCQFVAAELVLALDYLHSRGVVYRNLKPENILLDRDGHICLTDFGLSKIISNESSKLQTSCGTPAYSAPEILEGECYTKSVDWWSLGVVLYQMLLGFTPFEFDDQDFGKLIRNILTCRILYPEDLVSHNARSLLESFLQKNPKQRLDRVDEIKHHPFFDGIDWEALQVKRTQSPFKIELKSDDDVSFFDWKYTSQPIDEELLLYTKEK